jgi:branched-chain amino acid transport system permease protein
MSTSLIFQALLSGLTNGCVYGLVGLGIAVVFKGARIINVTQGEFSVIGAMCTVAALQGLQLPYPVAIAAGIAAAALLGLLVDLLLVRPMLRRGAHEESFLLLTIGLAFAGSAAVLYLAGRDARLLPSLGSEQVFELGRATVREHALWLMAITVGVVGALYQFYTRTLIGLAMTAASSDPEGAASVGINVGRMRALTFMLGSSLGALAGILVTPLVSMSYQMGLLLTLKGFAAAVLGGLLNPLGALVGGLTMALLESLAVVAFPSGYKEAVALSLLIAVMIVMPHGLLGRAGRAGG